MGTDAHITVAPIIPATYHLLVQIEAGSQTFIVGATMATFRNFQSSAAVSKAEDMRSVLSWGRIGASMQISPNSTPNAPEPNHSI